LKRSEGTREGLVAARARGQRLGRPPAMTPEQVRHARALLTEPDATVSSIARLLRVSRSTIYKYVPELATGDRQTIEPPPARAKLAAAPQGVPVLQGAVQDSEPADVEKFLAAAELVIHPEGIDLAAAAPTAHRLQPRRPADGDTAPARHRRPPAAAGPATSWSPPTSSSQPSTPYGRTREVSSTKTQARRSETAPTMRLAGASGFLRRVVHLAGEAALAGTELGLLPAGAAPGPGGSDVQVGLGGAGGQVRVRRIEAELGGLTLLVTDISGAGVIVADEDRGQRRADALSGEYGGAGGYVVQYALGDRAGWSFRLCRPPWA
jgi:hypothetical protein